jgi:hypothetical protein
VYTLDPRRVLAVSGGMVTLDRFRDVVLGLKSVLHGTGGWWVACPGPGLPRAGVGG